ncbi:MAG: thiamine pyrophosphate-dependent dehydrogenase E1 component subunit alpha [Bacteriovoracaceae bacterium]|nr:thiamine pyrophosphate-dependent dehydrogenase E1 component subunit alpha [Bacteriovoracaceae bacterium]
MLKSDIRINLLREMKRIRFYEEEIVTRYSEQKMRCPTHLSIGQEGVPAALSQILTKEDLAVSTHRAHAHYLGKGGDGKKFIAEIYGKSTGCSGGKGGSMHLVDLSVGFKGSTAIVGNSIPVGVGLGLAQKLDNTNNISCVFIGDAAVEEGVFYESANFAAVKQLPVLFVCENNQYSVYSPLKVRQPIGRKIFEMVEGIGIPSSHGDGNDVESCYLLLDDIVNNMKKYGGPRFVELDTYRWREHCGPNYDNHIGYRTEEEFLKWKKRDPIAMHLNRLLADKVLDEEAIAAMDIEIKCEVDKAFQFAIESPYPDPKDAYKNIYKEL